MGYRLYGGVGVRQDGDEMSFIRYRKGMSYREFQDMIAAQGPPRRKKCQCSCAGCRTPGTHCLSDACGLTRNRRSGAQMDADGRKRSPRVKVPKRPKTSAERHIQELSGTAKKPDKMRAEWFVDCTRGKTEMTLAAPDGEEQANTMADKLRAHGWEATPVIRNTFQKDQRFHQEY